MGFDARPAVFWAVSACVASGAPDDLQLTVDTTAEPMRLSWADDVPVHSLSVYGCRDDCDLLGCEEGQLRYEGLEGWWSVGYDQRGETAFWKLPPEVVPPIMYGQVVEGDRREETARPLEPGISYAAEIQLWGCQSEDDTRCSTLIGAGCVLFAIDG